MDIYFRPLMLDDERITRDVIKMLRSQRVPTSVSVFVELRVDLDYHEELVISEISIYEGYSVRSITPSAEYVTFDSPFGHYPTSARREVLRFANEMAVNMGGEIAIECNSSGEIISAAGGSLFGVNGRSVISNNAEWSVERELILGVVQNIQYEVVERQLVKKDLAQFDELFIADHYGVTSISRCGTRSYISSLVEKIIGILSQPF